MAKASDIVMAQLMFKLAFTKKNWGKKFDRLEHYKRRFPDLKQITKELLKRDWINLQRKPMFTNISLNTKYKKEILDFIRNHLPGSDNRLN